MHPIIFLWVCCSTSCQCRTHQKVLRKSSTHKGVFMINDFWRNPHFSNIFLPNEIIFEHCGLPMQRSRELLLLKRSKVETRNRLVFIHNIEKQILLTQIKFFVATDMCMSHCLGMNYYVNFGGGIGSNGFYIKRIYGTQDNWTN